MTILNGTSYENADFAGDGYVSRFPDPIFADLLSELSARDAAILADILTQNANTTAAINALSLPGYLSTTSLAIGTGAKNFTLTQAASVPAGVYRAYSAGSTSNFMVVRVTAATSGSTTLNTTCDIAVGSGTFANWIIIPLGDVLRRGTRTVPGDTNVVSSDLNAVIELTAPGASVTADSVASLGAGFSVTLLNTSNGNITFDPAGSETVDGAASLTLPSQRSVTLVTTTTGWWSQDRQVQAHDIVTAHTASGLTPGHVLRATGATTFAFMALQASDLPAEAQRAIRSAKALLWRRFRRTG